MSDEQDTATTEQDTATTEQDTATTEQDTWTPPDKSAWDKLRADADRRDKLLRDAQAKIAELSKGERVQDKPDDQREDKPDTETDTLRTALRRTAASAVLSGRGITDTADQDKILSVLHLDTLPLDERGTVDTSTLADTLDTLSKILGTDKRRPAPSVDTRRGSRDSGSGADPDSDRYKRIMGRAG